MALALTKASSIEWQRGSVALAVWPTHRTLRSERAKVGAFFFNWRKSLCGTDLTSHISLASLFTQR